MMEAVSDVLSSPRIRVRLFGPLEVSRCLPDGSWQVVKKAEWTLGTPPRSVLKRLLTTPGRRLSRSDIEDDLWPDTGMELAMQNLSNALMVLRRIIGKDLVETIGPLCAIAGQAQVWTDLDACAALLKQAENQGYTTPEALPLLEEALGYLERGTCLEDESEAWCHAVRADAERMCRQCRLWLAQAYERQGKLWQAGEQYWALCNQIPPDEEALRAWITILALHNRPEEALKCYQDIKKIAEAQNFTLSPRTVQLVGKIEEYLGLATFFSLPDNLTRISPGEQSLSTWPFLQVEFADTEEMLYDGVEIKILALTLQWTRTSGPISLLQQSIYHALRKQDMFYQDEQTRNISRRHALQVIAGFPIELYGLSRFLTNGKAAPPSDVLPLCAAGLVACRELRQYEAAGMQKIAHTLSIYLPTLEKLAVYPSPQQRQAAHLASQSYLLISILADHSGKLDHMEAACRSARRYGQLAQDVNLEASALARLAVKYDYESDDVRALQTYQEAVALSDFKNASPLIQGRIYAGLAGTYAYCRRQQESLTALGRAREIWPANPMEDASYHFAYTSDNTLALWSGLALKHTGRYTESMQAFLEYAPLEPVSGLFETNRADFLNYVASVGVQQRDLDAATLYVDAAATVAWSIGHQQRQTEIRDTLRSMQLLWPREPQVKHLQEKLYTLQSEQ